MDSVAFRVNFVKKSFFLTSLLLVTTSCIWPDSESLDKTVSSLTNKTILIRAGMESCSKESSMSPLMGSKLELEYDKTMAALSDNDLTVANWKKLIEDKDCVLDCSCYALSRVYDRYSDENKKKISKETIEKKLSIMTDNDYLRCLKKEPEFCSLPEIKAFLQVLESDSP